MKTIKINLLPEEMRKKDTPHLEFNLELGKIKLIGISFISILVLIILLFSFGESFRRKQIVKLQVMEGTSASKKIEMERINNENIFMKTKMLTLNKIIKRDFLWANKLNALSEVVLPGIWYRRIYTNIDKQFIIEGSGASKEEEDMALVGRFMKNIKENKEFFKDFSTIKLESVQRKNIEDRDIVDFKIVLSFPEDTDDHRSGITR